MCSNHSRILLYLTLFYFTFIFATGPVDHTTEPISSVGDDTAEKNHDTDTDTFFRSRKVS
jgi:hypothetical protein